MYMNMYISTYKSRSDTAPLDGRSTNRRSFRCRGWSQSASSTTRPSLATALFGYHSLTIKLLWIILSNLHGKSQ